MTPWDTRSTQTWSISKSFQYFTFCQKRYKNYFLNKSLQLLCLSVSAWWCSRKLRKRQCEKMSSMMKRQLSHKCKKMALRTHRWRSLTTPSTGAIEASSLDHSACRVFSTLEATTTSPSSAWKALEAMASEFRAPAARPDFHRTTLGGNLRLMRSLTPLAPQPSADNASNDSNPFRMPLVTTLTRRCPSSRIALTRRSIHTALPLANSRMRKPSQFCPTKT